MAARISSRARSWSTKWKTSIPDMRENIYDAETNPSGVISLALAENHLIHRPLADYLNKNFSIDEAMASTYAGTALGGTRLRSAMAAHINRNFAPAVPIVAENVLCANGVSAICSMLGFTLGDRENGVLLMRPIYGKFENDWGILAGIKTLYVDMRDVDPFSEESTHCYEQRLQEAEAAGTKVVALQISNPHNPSGICYPASTLRALMRFCAKRSIHLISDEIYALTLFPVPPSEPTFISLPQSPPQKFSSVLSIATDALIDPGLIHVEYGLAKDFSAAGLHIGALITHNAELVRAFDAIGLLHAPSGASCTLATRILEDEAFVERVVGEARRGLAENYAVVTQMLERAGIAYWRGGNAGYFLWIDLSRWLPEQKASDGDRLVEAGMEREKALSTRLLGEVGVWLNAGEEHGERLGWFRLIFSHRKEKVVEGVRRIIACLCGREMSDIAMNLGGMSI